MNTDIEMQLAAVHDKLAALGSKDAIAEYLTAEKYQGHCLTAAKCVLTEYFIDKLSLGTNYKVTVDGFYANVYHEHVRIATVQLGLNVQSFVRHFDQQKYPKLIADQGLVHPFMD